MKKFTKRERDLMEVMGFITEDAMQICYEGFEEAYFEQRANGIECSSDFYAWLLRRHHWQQQRDALVKNG